MTDAEYLDWLTSDHPRVVLAEFTVKSGGYTTPRYIATVPYISASTDTPASQGYDDVVVGAPTIRQAIGEPLAVGEVVIDNADGSLDGWLEDIADGQPITLLIGDPAWPRADFRPLITGILDHIDAPSHDTLSLVIRDRKELLNKPIQDTLYTTGPATGQPKPLAFGVIKNAEPVLTNTTLPSVYQIHDGPIYAVGNVRVNGSGWSYTTDLANGTVTLSSVATGRVTMDVEGEPTADETRALRKMSEFIRWVAGRCGLTETDIDADSMDALDTTLSNWEGSVLTYVDVLGYFVKDRQNAVQALDTVLGSMGCHWSIGRTGKIRAWRLDEPTGTAALTLGVDDIPQDGLRPVAWEAPWKRVRMGPALNWTPQDRDGLYEGLAPDVREYYGQEYLDAVAEFSPAIDAGHDGALDPEVIRTYLSSTVAAGKEARRLGDLHAVQRRAYAVEVIAPTLPIDLGAEIEITYPRFGFEAGANAVVVAIEESVSTDRVRLEVWK